MLRIIDRDFSHGSWSLGLGSIADGAQRHANFLPRLPASIPPLLWDGHPTSASRSLSVDGQYDASLRQYADQPQQGDCAPDRGPRRSPSKIAQLNSDGDLVLRNPIVGTLPGCCARAASGHAAAAPPSAASNSRRPIVTVIRPSRARCVNTRIPRHGRAVLTALHPARAGRTPGTEYSAGGGRLRA